MENGEKPLSRSVSRVISSFSFFYSLFPSFIFYSGKKRGNFPVDFTGKYLLRLLLSFPFLYLLLSPPIRGRFIRLIHCCCWNPSRIRRRRGGEFRFRPHRENSEQEEKRGGGREKNGNSTFSPPLYVYFSFENDEAKKNDEIRSSPTSSCSLFPSFPPCVKRGEFVNK